MHMCCQTSQSCNICQMSRAAKPTGREGGANEWSPAVPDEGTSLVPVKDKGDSRTAWGDEEQGAVPIPAPPDPAPAAPAAPLAPAPTGPGSAGSQTHPPAYVLCSFKRECCGRRHTHVLTCALSHPQARARVVQARICPSSCVAGARVHRPRP